MKSKLVLLSLVVACLTLNACSNWDRGCCVRDKDGSCAAMQK